MGSPRVDTVEELKDAIATYKPSSEKDWEGFRAAMNKNREWLRFLKNNGAAAELAREIAFGDTTSAQQLRLFLDGEGDLSQSLKQAIAVATTDHGLADDL
ncbi:MAG: hypothetical protein AAFQ89_21710 [Cyanobacteria bacterium J06626_18]